MIVDSVEFDQNHRYSVIQLDEHHMPEIKNMLKARLAEICYGKGSMEMEPDEYTYHKACRHLRGQLMNQPKQRRYAIIAEIMMHLISPIMLHFDVEPLSVALALQDKNIKHGFDINFFDHLRKWIWYGEVKSGDNQKRADLMNRAHVDLKDYFDNIESESNDTSYRWDAAKNEARVIFSTSTSKLKQILQLLTESEKGVLSKQKDKRNALIMTVNFGETEFPCNHQDIKQYIDKTDKEHVFDNYIILSVAKEQADDIILFLEEEGGRDAQKAPID